MLKLQRFHNGKDDTLGLLYIHGVFAAFVLEDEYREDKVMHETRIPNGEYPIRLRHSARFTPRYGHEMLSIENVPGFTGILIHRGNTEADTSGCLLVGNVCRFNPDGLSRIEESTVAYDRIYPIIAEAIRESPTKSVKLVVGT